MMLVSCIRTETYDGIKAYTTCTFFEVFCIDKISNLLFGHTFFDISSSSFHYQIIDFCRMFHDFNFFGILYRADTIYTVRSPYGLQLRAALLKRNKKTCRKYFIDTEYAFGVDMTGQNPNLIIHITEPYFFKSCIRYIIQIVQEHGVLSVCTKQQSVQSFPWMYHDAR